MPCFSPPLAQKPLTNQSSSSSCLAILLLSSIMEHIVQALIAAALSFSAIAFLFFLVLFFCRTRPPKLPPPFLSISFPTPSSTSNHLLPSNEQSFSFDPSLPHISLSDLAVATKNFSPDRILGDGGFGFVYKAIFPSGLPVAVKRLSPDLAPFQGFREFRAEMDTLARIRHPNLARLLAYCISGLDRLLIYEFLSGGSLDQRLHDPDFFPQLTWSSRLRILRGVAAGLAFLHDGCSPSIIHRDIKASNVLLDGELFARIADFGLARLVDSSRSHVSTQEAAGTVGYIAPEYREGVTVVTAKGDIYSFGVLVMEVVTGRRPNWPVKGGDGAEIGLVKWTRGKIEEGREMEILDPLMGKEMVVLGEVKGVLGAAYRATEERPSSRPAIGELIQLLDGF